MSASYAIVTLLTIVGLAACLGGGIYLIVTARRRGGISEPRCGNCGYNLTGAPANRCSECGMLFIEAGVVTAQQATSRPRLWVGIGLLVLPLLLCTLSGIGVMALGARQAAAARQTAAQQAAWASQQVRAARQQRAATSEPASASENP
jgi:hypothetical protein